MNPLGTDYTSKTTNTLGAMGLYPSMSPEMNDFAAAMGVNNLPRANFGFFDFTKPGDTMMPIELPGDANFKTIKGANGGQFICPPGDSLCEQEAKRIDQAPQATIVNQTVAAPEVPVVELTFDKLLEDTPSTEPTDAVVLDSIEDQGAADMAKMEQQEAADMAKVE